MLLVETRLGERPIHGIGVFSAQEIIAGALIREFHDGFDKIIHLDDYIRLPDKARKHIRVHAEYFSDERIFVLSCDHDKFMNHSDSPNTRNERWRLYAARRIAAGEELTCDYRSIAILDFPMAGVEQCPCI